MAAPTLSDEKSDLPEEVAQLESKTTSPPSSDTDDDEVSLQHVLADFCSFPRPFLCMGLHHLCHHRPYIVHFHHDRRLSWRREQGCLDCRCQSVLLSHASSHGGR